MNPYRLFRIGIAVALAAVGAAALIVGDLATALLSFVAAGLGVTFAVGTTATDARAGRDWRTAEPWGKNKADITLIAMLALAVVPLGLRLID